MYIFATRFGMSMRKGSVYIIWAAYFIAAAVCQAVWGDFPSAFFEFPVNAAVLLLWAVSAWLLYREGRNSTAAAFLLSPHTTATVLAVFTAVCLIQGFSHSRLSGTWWFVAAVFALLTHLLLVLLRGSDHRRPFRLRFILNHAGLLLALAGGFFGSPDTREWKTAVNLAGPSREAVDRQGNLSSLDYDLQLAGFYIDTYGNGTARSYEASVIVDGCRTAVLKVNKPYRLSWKDDLYLSGFSPAGEDDCDMAGNCILQVVRHPWKYAEISGILMMLAGCLLLFLQGPAGKTPGTGNRRESAGKDGGTCL